MCAERRPHLQAIERGTRGEPELKTINEKLLDECLRKQSRDNMSSILAVFPAAWEASAKRRRLPEHSRKRARLTCADCPHAAQPETRIHVSARYIIEWKPEDVIRWLEAVGYGEVRKNHGCVS